MVIGEAYNNAVQDIVAMGFTKEEVEKRKEITEENNESRPR